MNADKLKTILSYCLQQTEDQHVKNQIKSAVRTDEGFRIEAMDGSAFDLTINRDEEVEDEIKAKANA